MNGRKIKRFILVTTLIVLFSLTYLGFIIYKRKRDENLAKQVLIEDLKDEIKIEESKVSSGINKRENTYEDYENFARNELGLIKKDEIVIKPRSNN